MPSLGADMDRGTVTEWLVAPGDHVHRGDIVAVVDTDKADIEVEVFEDGVISEILVPVGEEVEVGRVLAVIGERAAAPAPAASSVRAGDDALPAPAAVGVRAPVAAGGAHAAHVLSPLVRHRADELGVDLAALHGSGRGGTITRADVEHAVEHAVERVRSSPLARRTAIERGIDIRQLRGSGPGGAVVANDVPEPRVASAAQAAVGALMARAKREIPHYYVRLHVDLTSALSWLEERNRAAPVDQRILPGVLLLRGTALAAREVPAANGWWRDQTFVPATQVDLGVAVARRDGTLVAPVIVAADALPLEDLARTFTELVRGAKRGMLRASQMGAASITITSLGDGGADEVVPIISAPQVAMVGVGRIAERAWAAGGLVGARTTVHLTLAADHRVTNGHDGSRFLRVMDRLLQQPEVL